MQTTSRGGFTLIEALMASVILAVAVTAFCTALTAASQNSQYSKDLREVDEAARLNMEVLAAQALHAMPAPAGTSVTLPSSALAFPQINDVTSTATLTFLQRHTKQAAREIAILTVTAQRPDGQVSSLHRIVTAAEMAK
ncbi:MAG TPA: prepilin-type N-terminal cleavage/methylation domain-containing protein [Tepidisphaeraceae bacterium]|jgi:prepilin-type N-terminal cleavage/methylation domain-containing protein